MTEEELERLTKEVPRRWLEYPGSIEDFLRYETNMDPENVGAAMQHIVNKCIDGMRNTLRFVLAYREDDVQAILTYMSISFGLQKFSTEIDQVGLMRNLVELGYTMHYREEPKEQEFTMPPPQQYVPAIQAAFEGYLREFLPSVNPNLFFECATTATTDARRKLQTAATGTECYLDEVLARVDRNLTDPNGPNIGAIIDFVMGGDYVQDPLRGLD